MAVTLSATLYSTSLPPKRNTNCTSTPVISNLNIGSLLPNLNSCKRLIKFSPRQSHVVASAVSGSPGKFSFSNSLFGTESSLNGEDAASLLETVKVFDLNGNGIPISDLWKDRTAVIAFARHFGCVFCRKRADYLASKKDIMDASGVALVLIGPGSIDQVEVVMSRSYISVLMYDFHLPSVEGGSLVISAISL
ncbi:hypothetical protein GBA52_019451 [Prunus armeniaca]|nr:hypothetical protein GBA52_019451 [Prunus armeniaca]